MSNLTQKGSACEEEPVDGISLLALSKRESGYRSGNQRPSRDWPVRGCSRPSLRLQLPPSLFPASREPQPRHRAAPEEERGGFGSGGYGVNASGEVSVRRKAQLDKKRVSRI